MVNMSNQMQKKLLEVFKITDNVNEQSLFIHHVSFFCYLTLFFFLSFFFLQKRRRKTVGDKLEEKRKKVLAKHPLQVVMQLTFQGILQKLTVLGIENGARWEFLQ